MAGGLQACIPLGYRVRAGLNWASRSLRNSRFRARMAAFCTFSCSAAALRTDPPPHRGNGRISNIYRRGTRVCKGNQKKKTARAQSRGEGKGGRGRKEGKEKGNGQGLETETLLLGASLLLLALPLLRAFSKEAPIRLVNLALTAFSGLTALFFFS